MTTGIGKLNRTRRFIDGKPHYLVGTNMHGGPIWAPRASDDEIRKLAEREPHQIRRRDWRDFVAMDSEDVRVLVHVDKILTYVPATKRNLVLLRKLGVAVYPWAYTGPGQNLHAVHLEAEQIHNPRISRSLGAHFGDASVTGLEICLEFPPEFDSFLKRYPYLPGVTSGVLEFDKDGEHIVCDGRNGRTLIQGGHKCWRSLTAYPRQSKFEDRDVATLQVEFRKRGLRLLVSDRFPRGVRTLYQALKLANDPGLLLTQLCWHVQFASPRWRWLDSRRKLRRSPRLRTKSLSALARKLRGPSAVNARRLALRHGIRRWYSSRIDLWWDVDLFDVRGLVDGRVVSLQEQT